MRLGDWPALVASLALLAGAVARRLAQAAPVEFRAFMLTFQQLILKLNAFWDRQGCVLLQPYDMEVGAGTFHTATFLRAIGPEPWNAAYVQPSRRPKDGRYGENPNRLQHYYQYQVVLKPSPADIQDLYLESLQALGIDPKEHDIRFVEDDWESPTLGAWGLGWEVWLDGMEVTQFTYFQQVGGLDCKPVLGEITYGLERLAMYLQDKENIYDLVWTPGVTYGDVYHQNEVEQSRYNFELSNTEMLFQHFGEYEGEAKRLIEAQCVLPAYEMVLKCLAHLQPARCARRDLRDRARRLHRPRAQPRASSRAGVLRIARAARLPDAPSQIDGSGTTRRAADRRIAAEGAGDAGGQFRDLRPGGARGGGSGCKPPPSTRALRRRGALPCSFPRVAEQAALQDKEVQGPSTKAPRGCDRRICEEARRRGRILAAPANTEGRGLRRARQDRRRHAEGRPAGDRREGSQEAADSQGHALGRRRQSSSCARCTAWSCCTARTSSPARCWGWNRPAHTRPSLPGQERDRAAERRPVRAEAARRGHGHRRFREAQGRDRSPAADGGEALGGALGEYQTLLDEVTALVEHPTVYAGEFDQAFLAGAAGVPDPHHAAEPEVFPAVRRRRQAAAEVPHRLQHEGRRPAPHRRRQRARGAAAARGRALLLQPGPQGPAREPRAAAGEGRLPQQARQPARARRSACRRWRARSRAS